MIVATIQDEVGLEHGAKTLTRAYNNVSGSRSDSEAIA